MNPVTVLTESTTADALLLPEGLDLLSNAEIDDRLTIWAGRLAAGEAQLLAYLGEFDERVAWAGTGILSCAHWMSLRLGMALKTASERVRVARCLRSLPVTFREFAAGRLSFTQVRAITRIATTDDEQKFVDIARSASGAQLERLARGIRRARKLAEQDEAKRAGRPVDTSPRLSMRYDIDGSLLISIRTSAEDGAAVLAALEAVRTDLDAEPSADSSAEDSTVVRASAGDGFLRLCAAYLDHRKQVHPAKARRDRAKLTVLVDPLSGWARLGDGELLPPEVARRAGLKIPEWWTLRRINESDLTRCDIGRASREVGQALRDLLGAVDGERCRFPSCTRKRRLHAHHVQFWAAGGPTDLANLILLCSRHHTVVHRDGFRLTLDPVTRKLTVACADGTVVPFKPPLPWRPAAELDPAGRVRADTLPPKAYDRLDLHYAVSVLLQDAA